MTRSEYLDWIGDCFMADWWSAADDDGVAGYGAIAEARAREAASELGGTPEEWLRLGRRQAMATLAMLEAR